MLMQIWIRRIYLQYITIIHFSLENLSCYLVNKLSIHEEITQNWAGTVIFWALQNDILRPILQTLLQDTKTVKETDTMM